MTRLSMKCKIGTATLCLLLASCSKNPIGFPHATELDKPSYRFDLPLRADLGEKAIEDEREVLETNRQNLIKFMERTYPGKGFKALRDFHTKAHGCVKAKFQVMKNIAPDLAQGVLKPNKTYDA